MVEHEPGKGEESPSDPKSPDLAATDKTELDVPTDACYHQLATLILSGVRDRNELGHQVGLSRTTIFAILKNPRFKEIYEKARDRVFGNLEQLIQDERVEPLLRQKAAAMRGQTLLSEVTEEVRKRIKERDPDGQPVAKAADLRVGLDAAVAAIDRSPDTARTHGGSSTSVNVGVFVPSAEQARVMVEAVRESGVDMSDVMDDLMQLDPHDDPNGVAPEISPTTTDQAVEVITEPQRDDPRNSQTAVSD